VDALRRRAFCCPAPSLEPPIFRKSGFDFPAERTIFLLMRRGALGGSAMASAVTARLPAANALPKHGIRRGGPARMSKPERASEVRKGRTRGTKRAAAPGAQAMSRANGFDELAVADDAAERKPSEIVDAAIVAARASPAKPESDGRFRDAIIAAASEVGTDGAGTDGLKGYLRKIANEDAKTYFGLLAKLMLGEAANGGQETVTRIERVIVRMRE
jgi:hypothetical protein